MFFFFFNKGCDPAVELTPVVGDCSRYYKCLNNRMYIMVILKLYHFSLKNFSNNKI